MVACMQSKVRAQTQLRWQAGHWGLMTHFRDRERCCLHAGEGEGSDTAALASWSLGLMIYFIKKGLRLPACRARSGLRDGCMAKFVSGIADTPQRKG